MDASLRINGGERLESMRIMKATDSIAVAIDFLTVGRRIFGHGGMVVHHECTD
jgi:hypothetical protein